MPTKDDFNRAHNNSPAPVKTDKPPATKYELEFLKKQREQPNLKNELTPPGFSQDATEKIIRQNRERRILEIEHSLHKAHQRMRKGWTKSR